MIIYVVFLVQVMCLDIGIIEERDPSEDVAFPWVGTLCFKKDEHGCRLQTGVVMLKKDILMTVSHTALTNEVVYFKRNETELILLLANGTISCKFQDYLVHPDYQTTSNTIALIHLICPKLSLFHWDPLDWVLNVDAIDIEDQKFLKLDYINGNSQVNQMEYVNRTACDEYYRKQELDYKSVTPLHYSCYQEVYADISCVYELGSALVALIKNEWTLLGISTLGPGCTLPSRFIDVYEYSSWLEGNIGPSEKRIPNPVKMIPLSPRSENEFKSGRRDSWDQGLGKYDIYEDQDMMILNPKTPFPLVASLANLPEKHLNYCKILKKGNIIYKDFSKISMPRNTAKGTYSFTFYDNNVIFLECIKINLIGAKKSKTRLYYEKETGFHQEDDDDVFREVKLKGDAMDKSRVLFLKDVWLHYRRIKTTTLIFEFDFIHDAYIALIIYGSTVPTPAPRINSTLTTKKPKKG